MIKNKRVKLKLHTFAVCHNTSSIPSLCQPVNFKKHDERNDYLQSNKAYKQISLTILITAPPLLVK
jgi:hypothetical protein